LPKYVIERDVPGIGSQSADQLRVGAQTSNDALAALAPRVQWLQSFITDDKTYCVYIADDERAVLEHAELSGFPANRVSRVVAVNDPTSAEQPAQNAR
jgi:hypothetical protein